MNVRIAGWPLALVTLGLFCSQSLLAGHDLEEVQVTGRQLRDQFDVSRTPSPEVDSATLLRKLPGANVNGNGPVSGIAQYRGMYGSRVAVRINGAQYASGGPNMMDPPLHYAPGMMLDNLTVYRGAAPVSAAQESIGGLVIATTRRGEFHDQPGWAVNGSLAGTGQTVNDGLAGHALLAVASEHHKFHLSGLTEQANDARFGDGVIRPSEYERKRLDAGYALNINHHSFEFSVARNETSDAGTAALPMDIAYIDTDLYRALYRFDNRSWALEASLHANDVEHLMSNFHLRPPPTELSRWRDNLASAESAGYRLMAEFFADRVTWRVGADASAEIHDSDIGNPNNDTFFVTNFNDASRQVVGAFGEAELEFGRDWELLAGIRHNQVVMDADEVGSSMPDGSPPGMLAERFNAADRHSVDHNIDWVMRANWAPAGSWHYTAALSRKTRSAAYQEKFLWLPLQATGGLADGRNYVGDLELKPEVAHEIELGADWDGARVSLAPRIYYRKVDDYIQGTPSQDPLVRMISEQMMGNPNDPLQFSNVEATIYGFDMDWSYALNEQWYWYGLFNYVRGKRDDIDDDLYRIAAPNSTLGLEYRRGSWQVALEGVAYMRQTRVSETNGETETSGYGLLHIFAQANLRDQLVLSAGINNLLDRDYRDHLAGINRATNEDIAVGEKLPGWGRNLYANLRWDF